MSNSITKTDTNKKVTGLCFIILGAILLFDTLLWDNTKGLTFIPPNPYRTFRLIALVLYIFLGIAIIKNHNKKICGRIILFIFLAQFIDTICFHALNMRTLRHHYTSDVLSVLFYNLDFFWCVLLVIAHFCASSFKKLWFIPVIILSLIYLLMFASPHYSVSGFLSITELSLFVISLGLYSFSMYKDLLMEGDVFEVKNVNYYPLNNSLTENPNTAQIRTEKGELTMEKNEIFSVVKTAVCSQLKSPASAQFPQELISIVGDDERGYQVSGFVDSQNSYGAMLRNDFTATVKIENGLPRVVTSSVGVKANEQRAKEFGKNYIILSIITAIGGLILYFIISAVVNATYPY